MLTAKERRAIELACKPGSEETWAPSSFLRVTRLANGRVRLHFPDASRVLYRECFAYVQRMIEKGDARDLRENDEPAWSFSFTPVD